MSGLRGLGRGVSLTTVSLSVGGCIEPNPDHCAFAYGNASCPQERPYCVVADQPRSHDGIVNGCFAPREGSQQDDPLGDRFIGVPYGLPTAVMARAGRPRDPRAMQAVLIEHGYPRECLTPAMLEQRFESLLHDVKGVREHLEKRNEHGRSRLEIEESFETTLREFGSETDRWVVECTALAAGTGNATGTGTDGTETGTSSSSGGSSSGGDECLEDADCPDPLVPYCDPATASCVACGALPDPNGFCASVDPLQPVCDGTVCVACTDGDTQACDDQLLVCDTVANTCVPCTEHDQCEGGRATSCWMYPRASSHRT